jgi:MFS family permease
VVFGKGFVFTNIAATAYHATAFQKSLLTAFLILPSILFAPVASGRLAPRYGIRAVATAGFALQAVSCAMAALPSSLSLLYVSQLLTGWGNSMIFPLLMGLGLSRMADERRATAMGFYQAVYGLGIFGGPWITGALISALGQTPAFWLNALLALLAGLGALTLIPASAGKRIASL